MKKLLLLTIITLAANLPLRAQTDILGETLVMPDDMCAFVQQRNPAFTLEVAQTYWDMAARYGIRGDIALCQAIIETGWFRFMDGTAVTADQYNFCGLGVTELGKKGLAFSSLEDGVRAQMQHLFAYATRSKLPEGEQLVDGRFHLVTRGCAPTWESLSGRWAANKNYGRDILRVYEQLVAYAMPAPRLNTADSSSDDAEPTAPQPEPAQPLY